MVPIPSAATVPAAVVEVVANRAAAVGQGTGRVGPHGAATEGITAYARIGDPLEVGPREFSGTACKAAGAEISGRTAIEWATAVEPTASVESASAAKVAIATESAIAIDATITTEVTGAAAKIAAATDVTSAEVPATKVTATAAEVATTTAAKVTATAAKSPAPHRPATTATATKTTTAMSATAAVRPRHRRGRHLARDHGRHDHNSEPSLKLHWLMHRLFSETGWGRHLSIHKSARSAHLLESQWRGVGQVHAVDRALDHVRRRLPLA